MTTTSTETDTRPQHHGSAATVWTFYPWGEDAPAIRYEWESLTVGVHHDGLGEFDVWTYMAPPTAAEVLEDCRDHAAEIRDGVR
jgi:hypothetical protein